MARVLVLRNRDVRRAVVGIPEGHKHVRAALELADGTVLVLQEATLANLLRAYVAVLTHPTRKAVELALAEVEGKEGYARFQLLETGRAEEELVKELAKYA